MLQMFGGPLILRRKFILHFREIFLINLRKQQQLNSPLKFANVGRMLPIWQQSFIKKTMIVKKIFKEWKI
jgi:hypothetical protein